VTQTINALYDTYPQAEAAVRRLEAAGVSHADISITAHGEGLDGRVDKSAAADEAGLGAGVGAVLGGGGGLLAGLGMIAIPGIGPVVAAGWLASAAVGAIAGAVVGGAAGGLVGALTGDGVPRDDAHVYAEGVRRGGSLVTARVPDAEATRFAEVLDELNAVNINARRAQYRQSGWSEFDAAAPPFSAEEIAAERRAAGVPAEGRSFVTEEEALGPNGDPLTPAEQDHERMEGAPPSPTPLV
jgi:hypothetical protein